MRKRIILLLVGIVLCGSAHHSQAEGLPSEDPSLDRAVEDPYATWGVEVPAIQAPPLQPLPPIRPTAPAEPIRRAEAYTDAEKFAEALIKGIELENKKNLEAAVEQYSRALELQSDSPIALIRRSVCYAKLGRNKEAADGLDLATNPRTRPRTVGDFAALSWLRSTAPIATFRDGTLAVAYAQKALKESETAENYDLLAAGYAEMGNFQKALDSLEAGLKFFPNSPRVPAMKERLELYKQKKQYRDDWLPLNAAGQPPEEKKKRFLFFN